MAGEEDAKAGFAGGQAGAFASVAEAAAASEMRIGMDAFRRAAAMNGLRAPESAAGFLFEHIAAARFNEQAALQGASARAHVTSELGRHADPADLEIIDGKRIIARIQAKVGSVNYMTSQLRQGKYAGMQRLVPEDVVDSVKTRTEGRAATGNIYAEEYADSAKHLRGSVEGGGVRARGASSSELRDAQANPRSFATNAELAAVGRQAAKAGVAGAVTGGVVATAITGVKQAIRFRKGEVGGKQAVIEIASAGGRGAVRGGATGAGGAVVSHVAAKVGAKQLAKTNIATTIAAATIDAGVAVYAYAKGDIDERELGNRLGKNGVSTMSSIYAGAAAGAVFGPVGALVGSVAGYMIASDAFVSTMNILEHARLTELEAERLEQLADECILAMQEERRRIEELLEQVDERREDWNRLLEHYDTATASADPALALEATADMACLVGVQLKFESFDEFDAFMSDPDSGPLVL